MAFNDQFKFEIRQYFTPAVRYDGVACGSRGHSVPYFGTDEDRTEKGKHYGYQKDGKQFAARDVVFDGDTLTMDLAPAYGEAFVSRVLRTFTLGERGFTLRDEFDVEADVPVTERFVFPAPFALEDGKAVGDGVVLTFDPTLYEASASEGDFKPEETVYFLDLRLKAGVRVADVTVSVE